MFDVITYKDRNGKDEIADYIRALDKNAHTSKDAGIRLRKIRRYIDSLKRFGTAVGRPTVDHITGTELWELRPLKDRIFFAYWKNNIFVLLHHFVKKTQKTPRGEIEKAQRKLADFLERKKQK